ncbi:DUF4233 domain-containing protein [Pseudokineococcus sp. 1T1Z-3]|uniref:DUF4233 domain-containing protein n=1 Tax=Pseudokineococcus sp. 1T1Z-3 TaxID=3132745 RepID=UPI0030AAC2F3
MTPRLAAAVLVLEAFLVFFAVLAAHQLSDVPTGLVWGGGLGLVVALVLASGLLRRPGGLALGWALQVLVVLGGLVLPAMFVLGGLFVVLWFFMLRLGRRVDADRAAFVEQWGHPDTWEDGRPPPGAPEAPPPRRH